MKRKLGKLYTIVLALLSSIMMFTSCVGGGVTSDGGLSDGDISNSSPDDSSGDPKDDPIDDPTDNPSDDPTDGPSDPTTWKIVTTTNDLKSADGFDTDEKRIRGLYEAGFRYIDFSMYRFQDTVYMQDGWREEVLKLKSVADELGMEFVMAHSQGGNPLNPAEADFMVAATLRSIEICEVLGIENTVVHAGWLETTSKDEWFAANKVFYEKLLPTAERCGVNVLCENSTSKNMGYRYYINTGADMREFIEYINHPNFHGCWDTGHANCEEGSQYDDIMALGDEIYAIHYAENMGDADSHLLPYCGSLNNNEVMQALVDVGYNGYFTLECDASARANAVYLGPEFEWMVEAYPNVSLVNIPKNMTAIEQEKLLYNLAEFILANYPTDGPTPEETMRGEKAFDIIADANSYTAFTHGIPTGVTATDNSVSVSATRGETGKVGFNITDKAVKAWLALGLTCLEFTINSEAPNFNVHCNFSSYTAGYSQKVFAESQGYIKHGSDGAYYSNGATVKIYLSEWAKYQTNLVADIGLKVVVLAGENWSDTYSNNVTVTISNIKFTQEEAPADTPAAPSENEKLVDRSNVISKTTITAGKATLGNVQNAQIQVGAAWCIKLPAEPDWSTNSVTLSIEVGDVSDCESLEFCFWAIGIKNDTWHLYINGEEVFTAQGWRGWDNPVTLVIPASAVVEGKLSITFTQTWQVGDELYIDYIKAIR